MEVVHTKKGYQDTSLDLKHRKELLIKDIEAGNITLSYSAIASFMNSPKSFIDYKLKERKVTDAMIFGNLVHCLILEPDNFEKYFAVKNFRVPSSENQKMFSEMMSHGMSREEAYMNNYKISKKQMEVGVAKEAADLEQKLANYIEYLSKQNNPDFSIDFVTPENIEDAKKYQELAFTNRASKYVLDQVDDTEIKIKWVFDGYTWRGVIDGHGDCYADLKMMANNAKPKKARYKIHDMGYHLQAPLYIDGSGFGDKPYYVIGMDTTFNISVIELHQSVLDKGRETIDHIMTNFKMCTLDNRWDESYDFWEMDDRGIHLMQYND